MPVKVSAIYKKESLSSNPQHEHKNQGVTVCGYNPSAEMGVWRETSRSLELIG